jgi:hypothetical protein
MTTPVSNNRPVAAARPQAAAKPAAKPVENARPVGDSIALSASAKATAPAQKTVVIDGKEYEIREKDVKKKWPLWEKITTFGVTGLGTVVGGMATIAMAAPMSPTGAMNPTIWAFIAIGVGISAASSYGVGRLASKVVHGVGNLFN